MTHARKLIRHLGSGLLLATLLALAGCSGGGSDAPPAKSITIPPQPLAQDYAIQTTDYFTRFASTPFASPYQFDNAGYPVPVSYTVVAPPPSGFNLKTEAETAVREWAKADPRVCIISGVDPAQARITVHTVDCFRKTNNEISLTIGLATVTFDSRPRFDIALATLDPATLDPADPTNAAKLQLMPIADMQKVFVHELGHALGLGHAPDQPDLMYYQANPRQGSSPADFVTFGDAITLWQALTARQIDYVSTRPTITQGPIGLTRVYTRNAGERLPDPKDTVCVYNR